MQLYVIFAALIGLAVASLADITLKPARRHDALTRRSNEMFLVEKVELTYAEDVPHIGGRVFKSNYGLQADQPILLLEEFDHLFQDVQCSGPIMTITMLSSPVYEKARTACESLKGGLVISSHFSCSEDDKHSFYRVLNLYFNEKTSSIVLELESQNLEDAFRSVTFHLGQSQSFDRPTVHKHDRLYRRQLASTRTNAFATTSAPSAAEGTHTSEPMRLNFSIIDSSFSDNYELPIDFGCKNCSSDGELVLTTVDLELYGFFEDDKGDDDPIKTGSVQFDLKGFEVSIGLEATPSVSFQKVINIFRSPRFGFNAGLVSAGIGFSVGIDFHVEATGGVELGFGFDVVVPDSTLRLDFAELQNSSINGINDTTITAHTLSANASDVEVSLTAGLQAAVTFGITLGFFNIDAGPYLSLPRLNMTVSQLATDNVGANCEAGGDTDVKFKDAFQNLTHVGYEVGLAAGMKAEAGFFETHTDFGMLMVPVATQCLAWQTEGGSTQFAPATSILAVMTAPPSPTAGGNGNSAGVSLRVPFMSILAIVCGMVTFGALV